MRQHFQLCCKCAVVVVEARPSEIYLTETTAMIIVGLALGLFGVGFLCWLLFTLAVYATPFFVGITTALAAFNHGAGVSGALIVGLAASVVTLIASRAAFALAKSPTVRGVIALVFSTPAAVARFYATLGLAQIGVPSEIWRDLFAVVGAILVGCTAFIRLARTADPISRGRSVAFMSVQPPSSQLAPSATRD
jgi:MFS family permease